jgi:hypothetical protein
MKTKSLLLTETRRNGKGLALDDVPTGINGSSRVGETKGSSSSGNGNAAVAD